MSLLLTFDIGTTAVKTCLFDETLRLAAIANDEYRLETPASGHVELDAERYWQAVCHGIDTVLEKSGCTPSSIAALCATTQGETLIPIGKDGSALHRAIVWLDARAEHEAAQLEALCGRDVFYLETGLGEISGNLPLAKLMWLKAHEPEIYAQTEKFLLLEDYLIYRLTGAFYTEKSLSCSTGWFSLRQDGVWEEILRQTGVDAQKLPEMLEPGTIVPAEVLPSVRTRFGFVDGVCVVAGAMDQTAGAVGAGNLAPGSVTETTGTALCLASVMDTLRLDASMRVTVYRNVRRGAYLMLPYCMTAGMLLKWFKDQFCAEETRAAHASGESVYALLDKAAETVAPGCGGLIALPYLAGSSLPHSNPRARGVFFGVGLETTKAHFIRAILEAVAFMLRENLELLERAGGTPVTQICSLGGGAGSRLWLQIKADVTNRPIAVPAQRESTSLGAAMLATAAIGRYSSLESAAAQCAQGTTWIYPQAERQYDAVYEKYCRLLTRLDDLF